MKQYCIRLSHHGRYSKFRYAELQGLLSLLDIPFDGYNGDNSDDNSDNCSAPCCSIEYALQDVRPLLPGDSETSLFLNLDERYEDNLKRLVNKSVLVKMVVEVYVETVDITSGVIELAGKTEMIGEIRRRINEAGSFAWLCDAFGCSFSLAENVAKMNQFDFLFEGHEKVSLKNPGLQLVILDDFIPSQCREKVKPIKFVLGRLLAGKTRRSGESFSFNLTNRPVLGPTTLDNELAFIMTNMVQVQRGQFVLDPFCGTGGLLLGCAQREAICLGSDLDRRVLRGWGVSYEHLDGTTNERLAKAFSKTNIKQNFRHYNLTEPDIVNSDILKSPWRPTQWVDVILTDPPYGVRAMARSNADGAIEATRLIEGLITLASQLLKTNGRLAFLLPVENCRRREELRNTLSFAVQNGFLINTRPCYQELGGGLGRYAVLLTRSTKT